MPSIRTAWRIGPLLEPGERLIWFDRAADRSATWLGAAASVLAGGGAVGASGEPLRGLAVVVAGGVALVAARALRRPSRPSYAATDRGRAFVVEHDRTLVFALPERIEVAPTGELDLGTIDVHIHPANRTERLPVRLRAVADPHAVAERLRRKEPTAARRGGSVSRR